MKDELRWHIIIEPEPDCVSLFLINQHESVTVRLKFTKAALIKLCKDVSLQIRKIS